MLTRRTFLRGALAAAPFAFLWRRSHAAGSFGPLIADPDDILDLPAGFSYRIIDRVGEAMSDGYRVPGSPDGMGCFTLPDGKLVLMRNHELTVFDSGKSAYRPGQPVPPQAYRDNQYGGVTRVVLDPVTYQRISSNLVLVGTARNCQGGPCPTGWLSAEEPSLVFGDHGYVFACSLTASTVQEPQRIDGYGRMNHESAWVDADTGICYLTEDQGDSCFYRFKPTRRDDPYTGTLQALKIVGRNRFDTSTGVQVGDSWQIEWVTLDDPSDLNLRARGHDLGAAIISRGEGLWVGDGQVWFDATDGGPADSGQVFRLVPDGDGGTLTLMAQSTGDSVLGKPDCLALAPWGDLFLCEDGSGDQHVRILHPDGTLSTFARNAASQVELAGICFSPDGKAMFLNMFGDGITVVITGPFPAVEPEPTPDAGVPVAVDAGAGGADGGAPRVDAGPNDPDAGPNDPDAGADGADAGDPAAELSDSGCGCNGGDSSGLATLAVVGAAAALIRK